MRTVNVGVIGAGFMGKAHSLAYAAMPMFFWPPPAIPRRLVIAELGDAAAREAAQRYGYDCWTGDWRAVIDDPDVEVVDIAVPNDAHAEIAIAAAEAGKHVLCEKPLARTADEARAMRDAVVRAGVTHMVAFNYRRTPAVALARKLIDDGTIGAVRNFRGTYLQDWIVDPDFPLVWRLRRDAAGSGALGGLGAHIVDMAQFLTGDVLTGVSALTETFVRERPLPSASSGLAGSGGSERGTVDVDDAALFLGRFAAGAVASFEATRFANGRKNALRIELNGSRGSLAFDQERMNELEFYDGEEDPATAGFRRILVTEPTHPYAGAWWPPGHLLGYEHTFTHQAVDLVRDIGEGRDPAPSFADGLRVQLVLDAVERSAAEAGGWQTVSTE